MFRNVNSFFLFSLDEFIELLLSTTKKINYDDKLHIIKSTQQNLHNFFYIIIKGFNLKNYLS